ncbi:hypothetical protein EVAR_36926_1 [Eumeta japonica]|uniref:Reverse transcriptase domain-containing protein n=1 Tax=Eumeta variegata TaxID=151549 RepID=A0A4C1X7Y7_EUMVA|nr:hypothetical protein EVAR_36926_1 [Eumeta japonica]
MPISDLTIDKNSISVEHVQSVAGPASAHSPRDLMESASAATAPPSASRHTVLVTCCYTISGHVEKSRPTHARVRGPVCACERCGVARPQACFRRCARRKTLDGRLSVDESERNAVMELSESVVNPRRSARSGRSDNEPIELYSNGTLYVCEVVEAACARRASGARRCAISRSAMYVVSDVGSKASLTNDDICRNSELLFGYCLFGASARSTRQGVKQGCIASPWLFNLSMDSCLYELKEYECGLRMIELYVKFLLYVNDRVIPAPSPWGCRG